ncbi:MAG: ChaN family lipoprotein [Planctomycetota bacterium]
MTNKTSVSIVRCDNYNRDKVITAIGQTFDFFGGIHSIIKKGTKVLLKPNFIKESAPEDCTITHPIVIEAIAKKALEMGATPIIGDSPAFGAISKIAGRAGIDRFAEEYGIEIIELDSPRRVKTKCGSKSFTLTVSGKALDVDAIINIPKLKAHGQLLYTAGVKNMYGCVSGKRKAWRHFQSSDDIEWYTEMLLANYHAVKPTFTIVDAIMAMEKHGPSGGIPKQVSLIFGGIDCIAIDRVIAEVINAQPSQSPLLKTAKAHNIGEQNLNNITILGESLSSAKIPDFILPKLVPIGFTTFRVMKSLAKHLWLKNFGKAVLFLLTLSLLLPMNAFSDSEANRLTKFPSQVAIDDIIHVPTGQKVQFSDLAHFYTCASVLYVGETHANKAAHQVQLKILKTYYEKFGNNIAIGMEMFTRPYQPFLDQWVAGEIDENKFLEETHWDSEWGYDYYLYKDILDFAREKKIPVIALNAPKAVVKMVSKNGLKGLSEEEKKQLPEIDTTDNFHRAYLERAIREHMVDRTADLEKYNDVQNLWEEYMAQTIADYLSSWEGKDKKFLAFAGNGHIIYDFGIPEKVFRRSHLPYYTIYPAEFHGDKPPPEHDLFLPEIPLEPADFVWVIPPLVEQKRIYLGVQLQKTTDNKLVIQEITPKSPAEKAGFLVGDVISSIDGTAVNGVPDLVHYLQTKKFGDTCTVDIQRNGTKISYSVTLFEIEEE